MGPTSVFLPFRSRSTVSWHQNSCAQASSLYRQLELIALLLILLNKMTIMIIIIIIVIVIVIVIVIIVILLVLVLKELN